MSTDSAIFSLRHLYLCSLCNIKFVYEKHLRKHVFVAHRGSADSRSDDSAKESPKKNPLRCCECDVSFLSESWLKIHLRTHSGRKQFACNECNAMFVHEESLTNHSAFHRKEKRFTCRECGIRFSLRSSLMRHSRRHSRRHRSPSYYPDCPECNINSSDSCATFTLHSHGPAKENPFHCSECETSFASQNDFETHLRTHKTPTQNI